MNGNERAKERRITIEKLKISINTSAHTNIANDKNKSQIQRSERRKKMVGDRNRESSIEKKEKKKRTNME